MEHQSIDFALLKQKRPLHSRWTSSSVLGTPLTQLIYHNYFEIQEKYTIPAPYIPYLSYGEIL